MERILVNYDRYKIDMDEKTAEFDFDKNRLMGALELYFKTLDIFPNWKEIEKTPMDVLISALAIACPFHPSEKQSILETVDIAERSNMITKIIEMNSFDRYNTANAVN
jgi:Lon protease-like protein